MNKKIKIVSAVLLIALLTVVSVISPLADTVYTDGGYSYTLLSGTTASLCGWDNRTSDLSVPKSVSDYYITQISDKAFKDNEDITSLDLTKAALLEKIGYYSFENCKNLAGTVYLTGRMATIGYSAFQGCSSLEAVKMNSNNLKVIPDQCFYLCSSLNEVTLPDKLTTINKLAFAGCTSLKSITIPKSVTEIDSSAFRDDDLVINCYKDSYAEQFAKDNGIDYEILDPLYGDANEDGEVNIVDVTFIQKYRAGYDVSFKTKYGEKCADVNQDGQVTVRDATLIQMKLAKMIDF